MAQDRKVFVGGVPQDLNQDDLYAIFSEYAGVKKAWLQKCRATDDNGNANPPQNHRGFGFVIFHDPNAIEELLGGNASRFIVLRSGAKLEVKRALSSSKMSGLGAQRAEAAQQDMLATNSSAGRGQAQQQQQQPLRAANSIAPPPAVNGTAQAADLRARHTPAALASGQHVRPCQALSWTGANGDSSVLGQLSLMPNAAAYATTQRLGMGINGLMPAGVTPACTTPLLPDRAPDGTSQPYAMTPQQVSSSRPVTMVSNTRYLMTASSSPATATAATLVQPQQQPQAQGFRPGSGNDLADCAAKQFLREAVIKFYQQHRPDKLAECDFVDHICAYYLGKESQLDDDLRRKYGVGLVVPAASLPAPQAPPQAPPSSPPPANPSSMQVSGTSPALSDLGAARGQQPASPLTATPHRLLPHVAGTAGLGINGATYTVLPSSLQGVSDPLYAQQPWLQPGMQQGVQLRPALQQAPPSLVPAPVSWVDSLCGPGASGTSPASAPGLSQSSNFSLPSTSAATNGVSLPGSSSCSSGAFVVANGTGNDDGSLQGSERSAEPEQEDDGFEISVSVAEAIVGKGSSTAAQGKEGLDSPLW